MPSIRVRLQPPCPMLLVFAKPLHEPSLCINLHPRTTPQAVLHLQMGKLGMYQHTVRQVTTSDFKKYPEVIAMISTFNLSKHQECQTRQKLEPSKTASFSSFPGVACIAEGPLQSSF